ncbi:FAD-binding oxidoreductase [Tabrizicola sp. BL-A-41-H6]|uniref:FAD-binding oxidoreductase n=1 Tax=Tabrizicola sp. BL-A-41-H6 TaxID=3421107 RepID=UPI003D673F4F
MTLAAAKAALSHLDIDDNPVSVKAKSRDFFWYSPVLKARLDHITADFVVSPRTEAEVIEVLKVAYAHNIPVTTRGAGTGNYGQAMPLAGGIMLHMRHLNAVKAVHPGRVIAEPGCLVKDVDAATRAHSGQELRMHPSTYTTATIGGFIAGGSGGVGSCTWGALRDLGNIIRLRVVTMEAEPRILEFTGEELHRVSHAYGTNGIITEVELPLAPAYDWVDIFVTTETFPDAARFAADLGNEDGILKKLITVFEAPLPQDYFQRVSPHLQPGQALLALMIAPHALDGFLTFAARYPGARVIYRSDAHDWPRDPGPAFEYGWNHTTLRALKVDPTITYLQVRYAAPDHLDRVEAIRAAFPGEVIQHLEVMQETGSTMFAGLSLVKFTTEARLDAIIRAHEDMGCMIFNPHRYTLEEGGRQTVDDRQLAFKREADPKGLLNPGKMIAWDEPGFDYKTVYAYRGMMPA